MLGAILWQEKGKYERGKKRELYNDTITTIVGHT
jgi:hypothetical protein